MAVCRCIAGTVVIEGEGAPPPGRISVQLIARRGRGRAVVAQTIANGEGKFSFEVDLIALDSTIDTLDLEVRRGATVLPAHGDIRVSIGRDAKDLVICVEVPQSCSVPDSPAPGSAPPGIAVPVAVLVRHSDGRILTNTEVTVDARVVTLNGEGTTLTGLYSTSYFWFVGSSLSNNDQVLVKVFSGATLVGTSLTHRFQLEDAVFTPVIVCDESLRKPSEYSVVHDFLDSPDVDIDAMTIRNLVWLQGVTSLPLDALTDCVLAEKMAAGTPANAEGLYALLRQGLPKETRALLMTPRSVVVAAIARAKFENTIDYNFVTATFTAWLDVRLGELLDTDTTSDSLGEILRASPILSGGQISDFCAYYAEFGFSSDPELIGSDEAFWAGVAGLSSFSDPATTAEAKRMVVLGTIAVGHAKVVAEIIEELGTDPAETIASWDESLWTTIVGEIPLLDLPKGLVGDTEADQRAALVAILFEHAQRAFPREAVNTRIAAESAFTGLVDVIDDNEDIDFAITKSTDLIYTDEPSQKPLFERAQRLHRVAPSQGRSRVMNKLATKDYRSARDIVRRGRSRFVQHFGEDDLAEQEVARDVYRRAHSQVAMAMQIYVQGHPRLGNLHVTYLPRDEATDDITDEQVPGWSDLFGASASGSCPHCMSIHGPSAYLVDLLLWLKAKPCPPDVLGFATAYDALIARRPDIIFLGLSCENTERALPYIDLTLEVLESVAAVTSLPHNDTLATTSEMLAAPQYINSTAYGVDKLGSGFIANRAFLTPFHQPLVEARAYLNYLGVSRGDLMRSFDAVPLDAGQEDLGLSTEAATALTTYDDSNEHDRWVFTIPSQPTVPSFRAAAGIAFADVQDLIASSFVQAEASVTISLGGGDPNDVDAFFLTVGGSNLSKPVFARMRQFMRLWRASGFSMLEIDKVLTALGGDTESPELWATTGNPIVHVANIKRLVARTGGDVTEVANWFAEKLDHKVDRASREEPIPSLYDRTFFNPTLVPTSEQADDAFLLDGDELAAPPSLGDAATHDRLRAVLGISEDELIGLLERLEFAGDATLARLTKLFAWCSLARAASMAVTEAYDLHKIRDISPLTPLETPAAAIAFLDTVDHMRAIGLTVSELRYLVLNEDAERAGGSADLLGKLGRIRDAVRTMYSTTDGSRSLGSALDELGRKVADEFGIQRAVLQNLRTADWVNLPAVAEVDSTIRLPATIDVTLSGPTAGSFPANTVLVLRETVSILMDTIVLQPGERILVTASAAAEVSAARLLAGRDITVSGASLEVASGGVVAVPENTAFNVTSSVAAVARGNLSFTLTSADDVALAEEGEFTLAEDLTAPSVPGLSAIDILLRFLRVGFWDVALATGTDPWADIGTDVNYEGDRYVAVALDKTRILLDRTGADPSEAAAWFARAEESHWLLFHPRGLYGDEVDPAPTGAVQAMLRTAELFRARSRLPGASPTFAAIIAAARVDVAALISGRTGWAQSDVDAAVALYASDSLNAAELNTTIDRLALGRRLGVAPDVAASWGVPGTLDPAGFTSELSQAIVGAVASKYSNPDAWAAVSRPVRDTVRKSQRDALVSYLIASGFSSGIRDADDLYQKYLIDVSMNPEMLTSRVKQATASIQLFVHRSLFGLEISEELDIGTYFNDEDRAEWEWMKSYRIWEAARKVFLYPENWIEPELRDDKTPFFRQLERELAQGEVNDERVETTMLDYLDRLHEVANLKVLACYLEQEGGDTPVDRLHVFGRSHSDPPTYWYRRREDASFWTAWQRVEAAIQGDHLIPVVYNRRLLLFWGEFSEQQSSEGNASWWEIRLAMSEYRDDKWTPKAVGRDPLSLTKLWINGESLGLPDLSSFSFVSTIDDAGTLSIACVAWLYIESRSFYDLGGFTLDPCTLAIDVQPREATESPRLALSPVNWFAPGFLTDVPSDQDNIAILQSHLSVFVGELDETQELISDPRPILVLDAARNATAVVPSQWNDFVSQSPFFLSVGTRTYFIEPHIGRSLSSGVDITIPSVSGISSNRSGTAAEEYDVTDPLTDDEKLTFPGFLDRNAHHTDSKRLEAISAAASNLIAIDHLTSLTGSDAQYRFTRFYHPYVCSFTKEVRRRGVFGLLDPNPLGEAALLFRQQINEDAEGRENDFVDHYSPTSFVSLPYPKEEVDFDFASAYGQYNWEVFFHLPLYLANRLADAGRYQDAIAYFHCIFDPRTRTAAPDGSPTGSTAWKVKPFLEPPSAPVTNWVAFSGGGDADAAAAFEAQVAAWRADPFNPHLLARMRPGTYPRTVVIKYIETLIAWGDDLFTRDTLETLNEATQLYVFAKTVLGTRPEQLSPTILLAPLSFDQIQDDLDAFGNALENTAPSATGVGSDGDGSAVLIGSPLPTYFCVPINAKLLSLYDLVDDRLFKIRNGMNIEGVARSLPLYEPPIDPALLVQAAAAGVDIGTVFDQALAADSGAYRFTVLLGRAQQLAGSVRALGGALLSAIEKRDGEGLARLRQTQEAAMLDAARSVRDAQVDDARAGLAALQAQRVTVSARKAYYDKLIAKGWISEEISAADRLSNAMLKTKIAGGVDALATVLGALPSVAIGLGGHVKLGGETFSNSLRGLSGSIQALAGIDQQMAGYLSTTAGYRRRQDDWKLQVDQAKKELDGLDKQLVGAQIRVSIAQTELRNHDLQVEHSAQVREFMERKFSNTELYDWMVSEISALHFQTWQLAYATAKKAERAYNHELGRSDAFVQPVSFDAARKGLLAGEKLGHDLERMDVAYLDNDKREFELVKHVQLTSLDPIALERLRIDGECFFEISEAVFDADCPGHYFRRLQSVAVSLASVAGPLGTVNAELTLVAHRRRDADGTAALPDWESSGERVVTSAAMNDSGVFSADPRDPRYLPFERRGAISRWGLRFTATDIKQLDWSTLTEATLHIRYTSRPGAVVRPLATGMDSQGIGFGSNGFVSPLASGQAVVISATRDLVDAWYVAKAASADHFDFEFAPEPGSPLFNAILVFVAEATPGCKVNGVAATGTPLGSLTVYVLTGISHAAFAAPIQIKFQLDAGAVTTVNNLADIIVVAVAS